MHNKRELTIYKTNTYKLLRNQIAYIFMMHFISSLRYATNRLSY